MTSTKTNNQLLQLYSAAALNDCRSLTELAETIKRDQGDETLDETLSQVFEQLKTQNVPLAEEVDVFFQSTLIDLRFYLKGVKGVQLDLLDDVRNRIQATVKLIGLLKEKNVDDEFLTIVRFVAQNLQTLKRQLKRTYEKLPWEEMEFCLVIFAATYTKTEEPEFIYKFVLDRQRIVTHLAHFKSKLLELLVEISSKDLESAKLANRKGLVDKILKCNPEFKTLYADFKKVKNLYSLEKMNRYMRLALSVDLTLEGPTGRIVVQRALQVIGECLNNTPTSPNVSKTVYDLLKATAPRNLEGILYKLRNSLTHASSLTRKMKLERNEDLDFFLEIQNDMAKIGTAMEYAMYYMRLEYVKDFLREVGDCQDLESVRNSAKNFSKLQAPSTDLMLQVDYSLVRLLALVNKIHESIGHDDEDLERKFHEISSLIDRQKAVQKDYVEKYRTELRATISFFKLIHFCKQPGLIKDQIRDRLLVMELPKAKSDFYADIKKILLPICLKTPEFLLDTHSIVMITDFDRKRILNINDFKDELVRVTNDVVQENVFVPIQSELVKCVGKVKSSALASEEFQTKLAKKLHVHSTKIKLLEMFSRKQHKDIDQLLKMVAVKDAASIKTNYNEGNFEECSRLTKRIDDSYGNLLNKLAEISLFSVKKYKPLVIKFLETLKLGKHLQKHVNEIADKIINQQIKTSFANRLDLLEKIMSGLGATQLIEDEVRMAAVEMLVLDALEILENLNYFAPGGCMWDDRVPLAVGKTLRNYLAHGNPLLDHLPFNPKLSVVINARKLVNEGRRIIDTNNILIGACYRGFHDRSPENLEYVQELGDILRTGRKCLQVRDFQGRTGLHLAAKTDDVQAFAVFADEILWHTEDVYKKTPPMVAAQYGSTKVLELMLTKGLDFNFADRNEQTLLHVAAKFGHKDVLQKMLLERGATAYCKDDLLLTPLHSVVTNMRDNCDQRGEIVEMLIEFGIPVDATSHDGMTPLQMAAVTGNENVIDVLLKHHAKIEAKITGLTPFSLAVMYGNTETALHLLRNGADPNSDCRDAMLPIHLGALSNKSEVVTELLQRNPDATASMFQGQMPLHLACFRGQTPTIKSLVDAGTDVNCRDENGNTPLHYAAMGANTHCISYLVEKGADINAPNSWGQTPLYGASLLGHADFVDELLRHKPDLEFADENESTAFHMAAAFGHLQVVQLLLEHGANPNARDGFGCTPLSKAGLAKMWGVFEWLLKSEKVDVDLVGSGERSLLAHAAYGGNAEALRKVLEKIPLYDKDFKDSVTGKTALHVAVDEGHEEAVKTLVQYDANVNVRDSSGRTPLDIASANGFAEIVAVLGRKADVNIASDVKLTPLQTSAILNHKDVASALLNFEQFDVDGTTNTQHLTSLQLATILGNHGFVQLLLEKGADPNKRDDGGNTALHLVCLIDMPNKIKIAKTLLDAGATVNSPNNKLLSPLDIAIAHGDEELERLLLEHGAEVRIKDPTDWDPLHLVGFEGSVTFALELLKESESEETASNSATFARTLSELASKVLEEKEQYTVLYHFDTYLNACEETDAQGKSDFEKKPFLLGGLLKERDDQNGSVNERESTSNPDL